MTRRFSRRTVLQMVGAATLLKSCTPLKTWTQSTLPHVLLDDGRNASDLALSTQFPDGLASGDPTFDGIVLVSRWTGEGLLRLLLWKTAENQIAPPLVSMEVSKDGDQLVWVEVNSLESNTTYHWALVEFQETTAVARSPFATFQTAPAEEESSPLRLAVVACTSNMRLKTTLENTVAQGPLNACLALGDSSYNDGAFTLEEFRLKWRESMMSDGWQAMRQSTSLIATWDDHEFTNNFNPETVDPELFAHARKAFFEYMPMRTKKLGRVWRKIAFGKTADVFVLDCRTERKPSTLKTAEATYISIEQLSWLKSELQNSRARFKLLMNSVPIGDFPSLFDVARDDRWEAYESQRREILTFIDDNSIAGVLWVSGDFHMASLGRVSNEGPGMGQTEILVGPGAQRGNPLAQLPQAPQFAWASNEENCALLEFNPSAGTVLCQWIGAYGLLHQQTLML